MFPGNPPVRAVDGLDLSVAVGEYLTVVGPSGSGKSTLMNIIGLLDQPTTGHYHLDGLDTTALSEAQLSAVRGQWIGFVFQSFHLLPYRTALENVELAGLYAGWSRSRRSAQAADQLDRVGLVHRRHALPVTLSGGERQRVSIARALAHEPRLLLCDEPTGSLDTDNGTAVMDTIDDLHADGLTVVVITHDLEVAARGTRCVAIADGRWHPSAARSQQACSKYAPAGIGQCREGSHE